MMPAGQPLEVQRENAVPDRRFRFGSSGAADSEGAVLKRRLKPDTTNATDKSAGAVSKPLTGQGVPR